jgi:hypothetical protein
MSDNTGTSPTESKNQVDGGKDKPGDQQKKSEE